MKQILMLLFFTVPAFAWAQPIEPGSLDGLKAEIQEYMNDADPRSYDRQTEFIILFIKVDEYGSVTKVDLMADEKVRDSTYIALSKMSPKNLRRWQGSKLYMGKTIILPVFSQGGYASKNYLDQITTVGTLPFQLSGYSDNKHAFVVSSMFFYMPDYYRPDKWGCGIFPGVNPSRAPTDSLKTNRQ